MGAVRRSATGMARTGAWWGGREKPATPSIPPSMSPMSKSQVPTSWASKLSRCLAGHPQGSARILQRRLPSGLADLGWRDGSLLQNSAFVSRKEKSGNQTPMAKESLERHPTIGPQSKRGPWSPCWPPSLVQGDRIWPLGTGLSRNPVWDYQAT